VKSMRRRASPKVLIAAASAVVLLAVGAVASIAAVGVGGSKSSLSLRAGSPAEAQRLLAGIPQHGNVLGSPKAPVTLVEYVDLQCPFCRAFETTVMPTIIRDFVRTGKLKVVARPIAFIGPDSVRGLTAAVAAAEQNRMFTFMQVTYLNQGTENTGWLTDAFVQKAAASVAGLNVSRFANARSSSAVTRVAKSFATEANADGVAGTPTLFVGPSGKQGRFVPSADLAAVSAAVRKALR
jgi:protein-disulfide isomerase